MEENKGLLLYGCNLAKDLEHNLPNLADKPDRVLTSCEEIIRVFSIVKERMTSAMQHQQQRPREIGIATSSSAVREWPSHYYYNAESVKAKELLQRPSSSGLVIGFNTGREFSSGSMSGEAVGEIKAFMNVPDSNRASSSKGKRKRKDGGDEERIVKMVAAPRMGNLEHPPEDGYTWKKYGQKEILGTKYPRSYYKCTHQKLFECPAKKQVQRLNYDPFTFEVTYIGSHSCTTMPSAAIQPPPSTTVPQPVDFPGSSHTTNPLRMTTASSTMQLFQDHHHHHHHHHVVDMADALFNSGGTVSNTMDFIFSSRDNDKWDNPNNQENKKD